MSTFFLYVHNHGKIDSFPGEKIAGHLAHYPWLKSASHSSSHWELIHTVYKSNSIRIFKDETTQRVFLLQGHIFPSSQGITDDDALNFLQTQILNRYRRDGITAGADLNGMYNLLVYSPEDQGWEIATDRLGLQQIFFVPLGKNTFILTTDLTTLSLIKDYHPVIEERGIFDLMYAGTAMGERTVLKNVMRLSAHSTYRIASGEINLLNTFRLPFSKKRWSYTNAQILDEFEFLYKQAIQRRLSTNQRILYLQSGGKDSRVFSYFLKACGITPQTITAGDWHHGEVFISRMVSSKLKFPWQKVSISEDFEFNHTPSLFKADSFSSGIYCPWPLELMAKAGPRWDVVTTAYLGDAIMGSAMVKARLEQKPEVFDAFQNYLRSSRQGFASDEQLIALWGPKAQEMIDQYKEEAFRFFESLAEETYQKVIAYDLRMEDRFRLGSVLRGLDAACPISSPCLDNDLMEFIFSLPPVLLSKRLVLDIFLKERAKEMGGIPLDQNIGYYQSLVPSLKNEISLRLWQAWARNICLPYFKAFQPHKATTQYYFQVYSMNQRGFERLRQQAITDLPLMANYWNIDTAKKLLLKNPSGTDHVEPGNLPRSLITTINALKMLQGLWN